MIVNKKNCVTCLSVGAFLCVTLLISIWQMLPTEVLLRNGCNILYDYHEPDGNGHLILSTDASGEVSFPEIRADTLAGKLPPSCRFIARLWATPKSVTFTGRVTQDVAGAIGAMQTIETLRFDGVTVSTSVDLDFSRCRSLRMIVIQHQGSRIFDDVLRSLSGLGIETICITGGDVDASAIRRLATCPGLRTLMVRIRGDASDTVSALVKLQQVECFQLVGGRDVMAIGGQLVDSRRKGGIPVTVFANGALIRGNEWKGNGNGERD